MKKKQVFETSLSCPFNRADYLQKQTLLIKFFKVLLYVEERFIVIFCAIFIYDE
jgi:hypothetical protein